MKIWHGLFMKERLLIKGWLYTTLVLIGLFTFIIPISLTLYFSISLNQVQEGFVGLTMIWFMLILFIPAITLTVSLGKEAERPDIWLHSKSSIFTLFGVKAVFASLVGVLNIFISAIFITLLFTIKLQPFQFVLEVATFQFWVLFLSGLFFMSLMIMSVALLFRVIYLIIRPYTKKITRIITFGFLILFVWGIDKISSSAIYQKISTLGKIGSISESQLYLGDESSYLSVDASLFYVGEILLNIGFASLLFIIAAILFEKKVRL